MRVFARRNRYRFGAALSIALMLGGAGTTVAQATYRTNYATAYVQEKTNWCWVASSKTVISWVGATNSSQCQLYKWGKGVSSCAGNEPGSFTTDVSRLLAKAGVSNIGYVTGPLSFASVRSEIDVNRVLLMRWAWDGQTVGHQLTIYGYNTDGTRIAYINPADGYHTWASYSWMLDGSNHTWTHTRYSIHD
ncbi:hypothetical protein OEB99_12715 [Actinotalea sp. M2MS4P-6]|uniref:papain-like cysteine protease family protein n=1 Tax=Actinotalea sp. M2MS4P-6 TaxID=2983762 RepID=UPI0021E397F4|nr:papain-like cysteine protease family protein [Actinotalea sp. M2MS4P-6]MCV2395172.1 hypothetical protein [Actinotalea sp. M2MS4P-6]